MYKPDESSQASHVHKQAFSHTHALHKPAIMQSLLQHAYIRNPSEMHSQNRSSFTLSHISSTAHVWRKVKKVYLKQAQESELFVVCVWGPKLTFTMSDNSW